MPSYMSGRLGLASSELSSQLAQGSAGYVLGKASDLHQFEQMQA